jgi:hypothetical protein
MARLAQNDDHRGDRIGSGPRPPSAPELDAVFLCESLDDVEFFVGFGQHPLVDVREVDGAGLTVVPTPEGWVMRRALLGRIRVAMAEY